VLHADHAVGAFRDRRPRHHPDRLAGADGARRELAGGTSSDHAEIARRGFGGAAHVVAADGEAVHRAVVPRRQVDRGDDVLRQHVAERLQQRPLHRIEPRHARDHVRERVVRRASPPRARQPPSA
jgi:hypothetical protein